MFTGQFTHNLDDKGRLTIPAAFKDAFRTGVVLSPGVDGCVWVYTPDAWQKFAERLQSLPNNPENRFLKRQFFSKTVSDLLPDRAGRIPIAEPLRNHAGIRKTVVIAGDFDKLELWANETWAAMGGDDTDTFNRAYDAAAEKGLL